VHSLVGFGFRSGGVAGDDVSRLEPGESVIVFSVLDVQWQ
jgi:hypothetical protein